MYNSDQNHVSHRRDLMLTLSIRLPMRLTKLYLSSTIMISGGRLTPASSRVTMLNMGAIAMLKRRLIVWLKYQLMLSVTPIQKNLALKVVKISKKHWKRRNHGTINTIHLERYQIQCYHRAMIIETWMVLTLLIHLEIKVLVALVILFLSLK